MDSATDALGCDHAAEPEGVAVIGTGAMGSRIAARLIDAGHTVVVWDRTGERVLPLVSRGATPAASPAEAARGARSVITMVADPQALRAVTEGPGGLAAAATPSQLFVEMSTVGPEEVIRLAGALPPGALVVDAPVLGSVDEAAGGSLKILVGGSSEAVKRAAPMLSVLGSALHCGPLGSGAAAKLVANAALLSTVCALGEVLSLAERLGIPTDTVFDVLGATPLAAQAERRRRAIETGRFPARFPLLLAAKDCSLIADASRGSRGSPRHLLEATREWFADAERAGLGTSDYTAILGYITADPQARTPVPVGDKQPPISIANCRGLVVDLDGVVWRDGQPIPGAVDAIRLLRAEGVGLVFVTNDPSRTRRSVAERLVSIGVPADPDEILTAGAATARLVAHHHPGVRVLLIGPAALGDELRAVGLTVHTGEDDDLPGAVVVAGHDGFNLSELRRAMAALAAGAQLFATGRDAVYPAPDGLRPATGSVLAAVEVASGVTATVAGKPGAALFELARDALAGYQPLAVVGDNLDADVAGAHRAGFPAVLALSGITPRAALRDSKTQPDLVVEDLMALAMLMRDGTKLDATVNPSVTARHSLVEHAR